MRASYIHVRSMRFSPDQEVLIACVVAEDGRVGYGISLNLDATEARHMAERSAGLRQAPAAAGSGPAPTASESSPPRRPGPSGATR